MQQQRFLGNKKTRSEKKKFVEAYLREDVPTLSAACEKVKIKWDKYKNWRDDKGFVREIEEIKLSKAGKRIGNVTPSPTPPTGEEPVVDIVDESEGVVSGRYDITPIGFVDKREEYKQKLIGLKANEGSFKESQMPLIEQTADIMVDVDYDKCLMRHPNYKRLYPLPTASGGVDWKTNPLQKEIREYRIQIRENLTELGITYSSKGYKVKMGNQKMSEKHPPPPTTHMNDGSTERYNRAEA